MVFLYIFQKNSTNLVCVYVCEKEIGYFDVQSWKKSMRGCAAFEIRLTAKNP